VHQTSQKKKEKKLQFSKGKYWDNIWASECVASGIFKRRMNDELQRLNIFELINGKILEWVGYSLPSVSMSHKESYCGSIFF